MFLFMNRWEKFYLRKSAFKFDEKTEIQVTDHILREFGKIDSVNGSDSIKKNPWSTLWLP